MGMKLVLNINAWYYIIILLIAVQVQMYKNI
jgi:hypothetical protein